jgi:subtilisin-like proprotein convertase family protein
VDNVVRVAASDNRDRLASFSNYGPNTVQIAAPGASIFSTLPNNNYGYLSGTSMAAPFVTGALALAWDLNPTWNYQQVIQRVLSTVAVLPSLAGRVSTGGRLDLAAALADGGDPPPPPADETGPRVTGISAVADQSGIWALRLTFSEAIDPASFSTQKVASLAGPSGALAPVSVTPLAGTNNQFDVTFAKQAKTGSYTLVVGPDIRDLAGNAMDQNQNGVCGEMPADRFSGAVNYSASTIYASKDVPKNILDLQTVGSTITIGVSVPISDLNVRIDISHTWVGDLRLRLRGPTGKEIVLVDRRGGGGHNFAATLFDDQAGQSIVQGSAPFAGEFRPEGALAAFNATNAKGYWHLYVEDKAAGNIGTLTGWSLIFNSSSGAASVGAKGGEAARNAWFRALVHRGSGADFRPLFSGNGAALAEQWQRIGKLEGVISRRANPPVRIMPMRAPKAAPAPLQSVADPFALPVLVHLT